MSMIYRLYSNSLGWAHCVCTAGAWEACELCVSSSELWGYNPCTVKKWVVFARAIELGFLQIQACTDVFDDRKLEAQIWMQFEDSRSWYFRHEFVLPVLPGCFLCLQAGKGTTLYSFQMWQNKLFVGLKHIFIGLLPSEKTCYLPSDGEVVNFIDNLFLAAGSLLCLTHRSVFAGAISNVPKSKAVSNNCLLKSCHKAEENECFFLSSPRLPIWLLAVLLGRMRTLVKSRERKLRQVLLLSIASSFILHWSESQWTSAIILLRCGPFHWTCRVTITESFNFIYFLTESPSEPGTGILYAVIACLPALLHLCLGSE